MADLSVSLFAADIFHMEKELHMLDDIPVFSLHVDIMDGHFVPLYGFNQIWIREIHRAIPAKTDFHFMAYVTEEMLQSYVRLDPGRIILHAEAHSTGKNKELFRFIKSRGIETGIAVSPDTPAEAILPYLYTVDDILVMSAQPGQEHAVFRETTFDMIRRIRTMTEQAERKISISVDGGINLPLAKKCIFSGADRVIMGRAFFGSDDKAEIARQIIGTEKTGKILAESLS